jgi:hypothetical protein
VSTTAQNLVEAACRRVARRLAWRATWWWGGLWAAGVLALALALHPWLRAGAAGVGLVVTGWASLLALSIAALWGGWRSTRPAPLDRLACQALRHAMPAVAREWETWYSRELHGLATTAVREVLAQRLAAALSDLPRPPLACAAHRPAWAALLGAALVLLACAALRLPPPEALHRLGSLLLGQLEHEPVRLLDWSPEPRWAEAGAPLAIAFQLNRPVPGELVVELDDGQAPPSRQRTVTTDGLSHRAALVAPARDFTLRVSGERYRSEPLAYRCYPEQVVTITQAQHQAPGEATARRVAVGAASLALLQGSAVTLRVELAAVPLRAAGLGSQHGGDLPLTATDTPGRYTATPRPHHPPGPAPASALPAGRAPRGRTGHPDAGPTLRHGAPTPAYCRPVHG